MLKKIFVFSIDRDWELKSKSEEILCDVEPMSSPHMQLQVVIRQLEIQNKYENTMI